MRRFFTNIISVIFSFVKLALLKIFHMKSFHFQPITRFSPNVVVEIEKDGRLEIGKKNRAHSGCKFKVRNGGSLIMEDDVSFNYDCMVMCKDVIVIKEGADFGPGVKIYDHDHDYSASGGVKSGLYKTTPIYIGRNVWVGADSIILRGTTIGDNSVIAAGSIVKGEIPANTLFVQKRIEQTKEI